MQRKAVSPVSADELFVHAKNGVVPVVALEVTVLLVGPALIDLGGLAVRRKGAYDLVERQLGLADAFIQRQVSVDPGNYDELEFGHAERTGTRYRVAFESAGDDGHAGLAHLFDLDHVVDHPRRTSTSVGCGAYYGVTLLSRLPDDVGRSRVVAAV